MTCTLRAYPANDAPSITPYYVDIRKNTQASAGRVSASEWVAAPVSSSSPCERVWHSGTSQMRMPMRHDTTNCPCRDPSQARPGHGSHPNIRKSEAANRSDPRLLISTLSTSTHYGIGSSPCGSRVARCFAQGIRSHRSNQPRSQRKKAKRTVRAFPYHCVSLFFLPFISHTHHSLDTSSRDRTDKSWNGRVCCAVAVLIQFTLPSHPL